MMSTSTILSGMVGASLLFCSAAKASFTLNITQQGSNVVAAGSGSLDLTAFSYETTESSSPAMLPRQSQIVTGPGGQIDVYSGPIVGPASFGNGSVTLASSGTGDTVGIAAAPLNETVVPEGYVFGTSLSDSSTWDNATLASLGLTPGSYNFYWDTNGVLDDTFTINIGSVSTPEPASIALLLGLGALAGFGGRKRFTKIPASQP